MNKTTLENEEKQLIEYFLCLSENFSEIEYSYSKDPENRALQNEYNRIRDEYLKQKDNFINADNKISLKIHSTLKQTFNNWSNKLLKSNLKNPISINHGMRGDNYLFFEINEEIKKIVTQKAETSYLVFYDAVKAENSFDKNELIHFFHKQISNLNDFQSINYFVIFEYYKKFSKDVIYLIGN